MQFNTRLYAGKCVLDHHGLFACWSTQIIRIKCRKPGSNPQTFGGTHPPPPPLTFDARGVYPWTWYWEDKNWMKRALNDSGSLEIIRGSFITFHAVAIHEIIMTKPQRKAITVYGIKACQSNTVTRLGYGLIIGLMKFQTS